MDPEKLQMFQIITGAFVALLALFVGVSGVGVVMFFHNARQNRASLNAIEKLAELLYKSTPVLRNVVHGFGEVASDIGAIAEDLSDGVIEPDGNTVSTTTTTNTSETKIAVSADNGKIG